MKIKSYEGVQRLSAAIIESAYWDVIPDRLLPCSTPEARKDNNSARSFLFSKRSDLFFEYIGVDKKKVLDKVQVTIDG